MPRSIRSSLRHTRLRPSSWRECPDLHNFSWLFIYYCLSTQHFVPSNQRAEYNNQCHLYLLQRLISLFHHLWNVEHTSGDEDGPVGVTLGDPHADVVNRLRLRHNSCTPHTHDLRFRPNSTYHIFYPLVPLLPPHPNDPPKSESGQLTSSSNGHPLSCTST